MDHELLVLSRPPSDVPDEAYNEWYDTHVREVLALPGFVAARRLTLERVGGAGSEPGSFTFLTRYDISGSFDEAWAGFRAAVGRGELTFEKWHGEVVSEAWCATPIRLSGETT